MTVSKWERGALDPDPWRRVMMHRALRMCALYGGAKPDRWKLLITTKGAVHVLATLIAN